MKEVTVSEFRKRFTALLAEVEKTQTPLGITRSGTTIAEIMPAKRNPPADWMGSMKD